MTPQPEFTKYRGIHPVRRCEVTEADVEAIEEAGDALIRSGHTQTAIKLYALSLRLRSETGLHPERRRDDAVT